MSTNLDPQDPERWAEFKELVDKMVGLGWVEKSSITRDYADVRFTGSGIAGLQNINKLERAFGGFRGGQADILFFMAQRASQTGAEN